jgi:RHS repeat-associated protein
VDLVTEKDGYAYEFFVYTPWGEEMHQWNANTFNFSSPYRFNGKELDPETGLAYYGARYYQNKIGVWLSVDRFANKYPNVSPYSFCYNNPQIFNDPTGDTIVNKAQSGTEEYIRLENGILNFKIKCPSAYAEMHAAPQLIEINFSDNNLISDLGRELNGNTTTNYLVENNTSILPQSLTRLVIENDEIFPEKIFNGIFEIKRGHDPSEWMTIYTRNQSIVEVQGFQITIDRHLSGSELNSTIGHEFGHSLFALQNPLLSYIWGLIQNNSHPNGRGHDKYNPSGHEAVYYGNQAR